MRISARDRITTAFFLTRMWLLLWWKRAVNLGLQIEPCESCAHPERVLDMHLTLVQEGGVRKVVYRCHACHGLLRLVKRALDKGWIVL